MKICRHNCYGISQNVHQALLADVESCMEVVLEILNSCLTNALRANPQLTYALLHEKALFAPFTQHQRLSPLLHNIQVSTPDISMQCVELTCHLSGRPRSFSVPSQPGQSDGAHARHDTRDHTARLTHMAIARVSRSIHLRRGGECRELLCALTLEHHSSTHSGLQVERRTPRWISTLIIPKIGILAPALP